MLPWLRRGSMLVIASSALLVVASGAWAFVRPDLALVQRVELQGNVRATGAELRHLAGVPSGTRIWELDLAAIERGVAEHPWVERARARRVWPSSVQIDITERVPVALLRGDHLVYVDAQGEPIVRASTDDLDYPVLSAVDPELAARAPDLPGRVARTSLELIQALHIIADVPPERVSEVKFSPTSGFAVHLVGGARVLVRHDDFERQLLRLRELRARGVALDTPVHVDLAPQTMAIVRPIEVPRVGG